MAGYKEILDDLQALLNENDTFKNKVSQHNFSAIADEGSTAIVLRVGGFDHQGSGFGGEYAVAWDFFIDIYETYGANIEEDIENLVKARDTVIDIIEKNTYLGKGAGSVSQITEAFIVRGEGLGVVFDEDEKTVTHFTLSVLIQVQQQHSVTLAE